LAVLLRRRVAPGAVFVFDSGAPPLVTVYDSLESVRGLLESLDVDDDGSQPAFITEGRVVRLLPSSSVFADAQPTDEVDLERLRRLLREARGPAQFAEDPVGYAQEWRRLDELEAERPPFVPERVWSWYSGKFRARQRQVHAQVNDGRRLRVQWLDRQGARLRVAFLASPDRAWVSEVISQRQLSRHLGLAQIEDIPRVGRALFGGSGCATRVGTRRWLR
jgi:hypothetical protein